MTYRERYIFSCFLFSLLISCFFVVLGYADPVWPDINSSTPTNYSPSTLSEFNVTWNDTSSGIDTHLITIRNSTGVLINNASMNNDTYGGQIFNYSVILPAGTFNWTSYAKDTAGNWSSTDTWIVTIEKAIPVITISNGSSTINTSGLVGYWRFESVNSTNYTSDSSGHGNNGLLKNFNNTTKGRFGNALDFDGEGDYVEITDANSLDASSRLTISAWIYIKEMKSQGIIDKDKAYTFNVHNSKLYFDIKNATTWCGGKDGTGTFVVDTWYHVALVYNGTHLMDYVNGALDNMNDCTGVGDLGNSTSDINIGLWAGNYFNGIMDEVMIFNRDLDKIEITMLYETSGIYPIQYNFSYYETNDVDSDVNYTFYRNETNLLFFDNTSFNSTGYYYYFVNSTIGTNYTKVESPVIPLRIIKPRNMSYCSLTSLVGWMVYNEFTTISCSCIGDGVIHLYKDGELVDPENNMPVNFIEGNYNYMCNITETENYTSASNSSTLVVREPISEDYLLKNIFLKPEIKIISDKQDFSKQSTDEVQYMILEISVTNKNVYKKAYADSKISIPDNGNLLNSSEVWQNSNNIYHLTIDKLDPLETKILNISYYGDWIDIDCEEVKQDRMEQSTLYKQYLVRDCELNNEKSVYWKGVLINISMSGECEDCNQTVDVRPNDPFWYKWVIDDFEDENVDDWGKGCNSGADFKVNRFISKYGNYSLNFSFIVDTSKDGCNHYSSPTNYWDEELKTSKTHIEFLVYPDVNPPYKLVFFVCEYGGINCDNIDYHITDANTEAYQWNKIELDARYGTVGNIWFFLDDSYYSENRKNVNFYIDQLEIHQNEELDEYMFSFHSNISWINYTIEEARELEIVNQNQFWSQKIILNNIANIDLYNVSVFIPSNLKIDENSLSCLDNVSHLNFIDSKILFIIPKLEAGSKNIIYEIKFSTPINETSFISGLFINPLNPNTIFEYILVFILICISIIVFYTYHSKKEKINEAEIRLPNISHKIQLMTSKNITYLNQIKKNIKMCMEKWFK